jgi:hypothetical protein
MNSTDVRHHLTGASMLLLILIGNALFLNFCAFRGFYHFDFGLFLDAGWRIYRGQQMYVDFFYHAGPVHPHLIALFFYPFGFSKAAIFAHLVTIGSAVIIATYFSALRKIPLVLVLLVATLSATCYYTNRPHPWYDQSAYLWVILGIWLLVHQLPFKSGRAAFWTGLGTGVFAILALMTKQNIGLICGLVFGLVLLCSPERIKAVSGYALGTGAAFAAIVLASGAPLIFLESTVAKASNAAGSRVSRLLALSAWFKNYYWLPAMIVLCNAWRAQKGMLATTVLFLGTFFIALFSFHTGSERYAASISLMGIYVAHAFVILYQMKTAADGAAQKLFHRLSVFILFVFAIWEIVFSAHFAYLRATEPEHPEPKLPRYRNGDYQLKIGPFQGWRFDENDGRTLDEIVLIVGSAVPKSESLLILTHLNVVYGLAGRDGYLRVPVGFVANYHPARGKQWDQVHERLVNDPPDWLLIHRSPNADNVNELVDYLELPPDWFKPYSLLRSWGRYALLKRDTGQ